MATYIFQCCGRSVTDPNVNSAVATFQHLCLQDQPCIGIANIVNGGVVSVAADPATEVVDPSTGQIDGTDGGTVSNGDGQ
jgi:hypothetical protein